MMSNPNANEIARDEALLIARIAYNEALREGRDEDDAQEAFDEALDEQLA